jgi:uncharacterized protein (DUF1330 family)
MATYVVLGVRNITDEGGMARYNELGKAATAKHKMKFLAGPTPNVQLEGIEQLQKVVLLEFEDRAAAEKWYFSADYQEARKIREAACDAFVVMIDSAAEHR